MKRDVHRALELLEEYHADLIRTSDVELKYNIERVVNSFKSGLFSALCDIQEFYDNILLNPNISFVHKTVEARKFADRWDGTNAISHSIPVAVPSQPYSRPSSAFSGVRFGTTEPIGTGNILTYSASRDPQVEDYDIFEIVIDASQAGLGFSISGGSNRPPAPDQHIRVTEIKEKGAVWSDGRVRIGDVILRVNSTDVTNVPHEVAVAALNSTGERVTLLIKRDRNIRSLSHTNLSQPPSQPAFDFKPVHRSRSLHQLPQPTLTGRPVSRQSFGAPVAYPQPPPAFLTVPRRVLLRKGNQGLGFNIVGGESGEPIYISQVMPNGVAALSGNVKRGDVLLRVNDIDLSNATHNDAAQVLKSIPPNSNVDMILHYRPEESSQFFTKLQKQSQLTLNQYGR
ncbi:unnamed protein product [Bursaphelenchus okinawaensis]|uniref:PDZ domain-containing protein n=1 Tax=Bursaphelenchus okinawaensis TaxID=465554 RepID=A0A811LI61_9BILA|nr:unnamed protein product [Bursaphelenchus okinawaensis]CAG9126181.1 unnamed protein product [Bursaphelenchus okinawaensis]